jgi:hypothetical protein
MSQTTKVVKNVLVDLDRTSGLDMTTCHIKIFVEFFKIILW